MPDYTDNIGNTYSNRNVCRSFNIALTTTLSALTNQVCSEVVIINRSGGSVLIYDNGFSNVTNSLLLSGGESFVIRGITNAMHVSAVMVSGTGSLYYRTQYFSSSVQ